MKQHGPLVVECRACSQACAVSSCQTLLESGLAFGTRKLLYGGVFFANGGIGFAFQLMEHLTEVTKLVEIIRHPQGQRTQPSNRQRGPAPDPSQAKAEEMVVLKRFKCARQVSADRSDASSILTIVVLRASMVTKMGVWMAKISSLR